MNHPARATDDETRMILSARDLHKHFAAGRQPARCPRDMVRAVNGVSFDIFQGQTLGLVGESGCGKTTLSRMLLRLIEPTRGQLRFEGEDVLSASGCRLHAIRRRMQLVFQDPTGSLNPRMRVGAIVAEPLVVHRLGDARQRHGRVIEVLERVGLRESDTERYPHEFSGGQRQRIGIARALAPKPSLLICDEPVSALDVSVQSQILNLLSDLKSELGLSMLFITHDLAVVRYVSDQVAVMHGGRFVEVANTATLFTAPSHPYTKSLLAAIPEPLPHLGSRLVDDGSSL